MIDSHVIGAWASITTKRHGNQDGNCPAIHTAVLILTWKLFELGDWGSNNTKSLENIHAESFGWIGEFGYGNTGALPTQFAGCHFTIDAAYLEPYMFVAGSPLVFTACDFRGAYTSPYVFNWLSINSTTFIGCRFNIFPDTINAFIGLINQCYQYQKYNFIGCEVDLIGITDSGIGLGININNDFSEVDTSAARRLIVPWTQRVSLWSNTNCFTAYKIKNTPFVYSAAVADVDITGTSIGAILTFTATDPMEFVMGDIICWKVSTRDGLFMAYHVPAFRVTGNVAGAVTAVSLIASFDATYDPVTLVLVIPRFLNAAQSTGDTHSNTTIDNVTTIANFKIGDYIQGDADIPAGTRIINIVGTTITLNKAAIDTNVGITLYNSLLTAL